ncbi:MAG: tRNA lysidine(34) synthetase TilS [Actinomycetia bacterium]|nr:tRNA lysidine(34) synthetase TilS [Actinomycetes bacterium]
MARRALCPAQQALVGAVRAGLESGHARLGPDAGSRVRAACSGGADSLALAAALAWHARHTPTLVGEASALVVDHGLQPGSAAVAARTAAALGDLGLPATVTRVHVDERDPAGLEASARAARYAALAAPGAGLVLLGHTLDDQAETVLLGLARGSGTRSLAGMPATSGDGPLFVRPLLGLRRTTTRQACADWGLTPWDDPMNDDDRFARVRARALLPTLEAALGPGIAEALARTATLARADADCLDDLARTALAGLGAPKGTLPVAAVRDLPPALASRVVRGWLAACGAATPTLATTTAVLALVHDWHGQRGVDVAGGTVVRRGPSLSWQAGADA